MVFRRSQAPEASIVIRQSGLLIAEGRSLSMGSNFSQRAILWFVALGLIRGMGLFAGAAESHRRYLFLDPTLIATSRLLTDSVFGPLSLRCRPVPVSSVRHLTTRTNPKLHTPP